MTNTPPTDHELALRIWRGEAHAFGELVQRYQASVFNVCYRLAGERQEAEDLTQEAFLRAYQRFERYDLERPFGPWVRRLAANVCLNHLAARPPVNFELEEERGEQDLSVEWLEFHPGGSPERAQERKERAQAVRAALLALPLQYRAVIELRHFQEMSYAEIASQLNIPLSDVKSNLFRARLQLAKLLHAEEIGVE